MPFTNTEQMPASQSFYLEKGGAITLPPPLVQAAPIANLPVELVLKIIQFAIDDAFCGFPIAASHVCSHWRALTLDSPLLWTTVYIHNLNSDNLTHQLERAAAFATRSTTCFMTVFVDLSPPDVSLDEAQGLVVSVAAFIDRHKQRIRNISIRYTPEFQGVGVSTMVPHELARSLEICSIQSVPSDFFDEYPMFDGTSDQIIVPFFQLPVGKLDGGGQAEENFPNLVDLSLTATALVWGSFAPRSLQCLSLQDLTSSTAPTWTELCDMLEANASTLVDLDIGWVHPLGTPTHQPFWMPALRKLRIAYTDSTFLLFFVAVCQVPSLEEFHLHDEAGDQVNVYDPAQSYAFAAMLAYMPLPRIRYLHLSGITFLPEFGMMVTIGDDPMPVALLRRLCSLERLKLTSPDRSTLAALNQFLPHLWCTRHKNGTEPPLLQVAPLLSQLSLRQVHPRLLSEFLEGRAAMASRGPTPVRMLDVLDVRFDWQAPEVDAARFAATAHNIVDHLEILDSLESSTECSHL
ncbi:hypothetical protein BD779DRAFT_1569858 [Infundibulicybe gibba]|nr:hypothetical protein BD779DRAFT_1569858 [Infundibulicybe gibba]